METYQLSDGLILPKIGLGTYHLTGNLGINAISTGINNGYRLIDTAFNYENEGVVGAAIKRSNVPRSQLIITSKLPGRHQRYQEAIDTIEESLQRTDLDYFDLYLIHWPNPLQDEYVEAWQALIAAQKFGLVRSIGVSNFLPEHLARLKKETGILPSVNQIELHPYFNQANQRQTDTEQHILTEAWSPLARGGALLKEPIIIDLAQKYHKSAQQIILRWETQLQVLPIPKASSSPHQIANLNIFDFALNNLEMAQINQLSKPNGRMHQQNPAVYQEF